MAANDGETIEVKYGGCRALVRRRARDGYWSIKWREARRGRSTTVVTKEGALARAREIVRGLAGGQGGRMVTADELAMLDRLKVVCGDRHPVGLLGLLEHVAGKWGIKGIEDALRHYEASGLGDVVRVPLVDAVKRFLDLYDSSPWVTRNCLKVELMGLVSSMPGLDVVDVGAEILKGWVSRKKRDGARSSARTINNRAATWVTFLNRCREWGYLPRGEKHAGEMLGKVQEPRRMVPIWKPETVWQVVDLVTVEMPRHLPYLVLTCFLGLRPSEAKRVRWELFDWERSALFCDLSVAQKLQQERWVPVNATARGLLERWLRNNGLWAKAVSGTLTGKCGVKRAMEAVSELVRERGLVSKWEVDVTRHSWISYMIALGHSKHEIAEWAGNSEAVIRTRYRHPLRRGDGERWFAQGAEGGAQSAGCRALMP